jgi:hypothetical protein
VRRVLASVSLVATLVACGGDDVADEPAVSATAAAEAPAASVGAGGAAAIPSALDFDARLLDGTTFDARQYAGETVVFWFWAPY